MKQLKIKSMAKDMSVKDRAKLIFADLDRRSDTEDREYVLGPGEEEALVGACRDEHRIDELNRLVALYGMANLVMGDVQVSTLGLQLVVSRLETYLYLLTYQRTKRDDFHGVFIDVEGGGFAPNDLLQMLFVRAIQAAKKVKKVLMTVDYISELAGMVLIAESDEQLIVEAKETLDCFVQLDGVIGVMKIFANMIKEGVVARKDYKQKVLCDFLSGKMEVVELNEEDEEAVKAKVNRILVSKGHPIT